MQPPITPLQHQPQHQPQPNAPDPARTTPRPAPRRPCSRRRIGCHAPRAALAFAFAFTLALLAPAAPLQAGPADEQFTFAVRLMKEGDRQLADEAFTDFLRDYPNDRRVDDARYYRALLARQAGDRDAAAELLDRVDDPLHVSDAAVKLLQGQLALEEGQTRRAVAAFEAIDEDDIADDRTRLTWHYLRGLAYQRQGNPEAAAAQFDKAAEAASPIQGPALLALGKARVRLNQPRPAMDALARAAKTAEDPARAAEARRLAGDLAYQQKQYEQAVAFYQHVVENQQSAPAFPDAVAGLLRALFNADQLEKFLTRYNALARHIPADRLGETLYFKAAAHLKRDEFDPALDALDSFDRRTDDDHPLADDAQLLRGLALYRSDPPAFARWYDKADPSSRRLAYLRAAAASQAGQPAQAVKHLAPLVKDADAPYARQALLRRAYLQDRLEDRARAADDYAAFAERYPDDAQARDARRRAIDLFFNADRHDRVIELAPAWLKDARPGPPAAAARLKLAVALIRKDQPDRAIDQLDAVLNAKPSDRVKALAHFYRGLVLTGQADKRRPRSIDAATDALEAALAGDLPDGQKTEALAMTARLHRLAGNDAAALDAYEKLGAIRSAGEFEPAVALWVGRGMVDAGQPEDALPWLDAVADQQDLDDRYRAQAMFFRARALHQLQRWRDAVEAYRRLLAFGEAYGNQAQLGLAQTLAASGNDRVEDALEEYNGLLDVKDTRVAASALYESALLHLKLADQARRAGFERAAEESTLTARRRLSRLALLYDLPQLGALPLRAIHRLGRLHAERDNPDAAARQFDKLLDREGKPAWAMLGRAERMLLADPPQAASAKKLLDKLLAEHPESAAAELARQRVRQIEQQP